MSTTNMFKYVHGEVFEATKIAQPVPGTGIVNIVGSDGVTPIGFTSISLFDDSSGTTELVLDTDYTIQEKDIEYSDKEGVDVYRSVQIINPAYQSAVFYADVDIVGAYTQYFPFPIGATYVQYASVEDSDPDVAMPEAESPEELYGGTWALLYDDEGIDFHTEGYDTTAHGASANRTNGLQYDSFQGFRIKFKSEGDGTYVDANGNIKLGAGSGSYAAINVSISSAASNQTPLSHYAFGELGSYGTPRLATRTADRNRWMRLWKKTAI